MSDAVLTGEDLRACACCGGMTLNMGNNQDKYADGFYLVDSLPSGFLHASDTFPMRVSISWRPSTNPICNQTNRIIVKAIERRP